MYKIKVNDNFEYQVESKGTEVWVNNELLSFDRFQNGLHSAHVIYQNKSFVTEIVDLNKADKTCIIKVNGNIYRIDVEDQFDQLLKQMGLDNLTANKIAEIKAPMPGLVLKILVKEGGEIKKGDSLLILEAMKMENILKSSTEGEIKKILINQGDKVEKNQLLIQFK